jgi:hypothetical protein
MLQRSTVEFQQPSRTTTASFCMRTKWRDYKYVLQYVLTQSLDNQYPRTRAGLRGIQIDIDLLS